MGKDRQKNNVLRVELNQVEIARRLRVTRPYVSYLLSGQRFNLEKLRKIRAIIVQEQERLSGPVIADILGRLDRLIADAARKTGV